MNDDVLIDSAVDLTSPENDIPSPDQWIEDELPPSVVIEAVDDFETVPLENILQELEVLREKIPEGTFNIGESNTLKSQSMLLNPVQAESLRNINLHQVWGEFENRSWTDAATISKFFSINNGSVAEDKNTALNIIDVLGRAIIDEELLPESHNAQREMFEFLAHMSILLYPRWRNGHHLENEGTFQASRLINESAERLTQMLPNRVEEDIITYDTQRLLEAANHVTGYKEALRK